MYAVVDDRNQQYRVSAGDRIRIHLRADAEVGSTLTFDKVYLVGGEGEGKIGKPFVEGASVTAKVLRTVKGPKIRVAKYKRRKNMRRRTGFRARYTEVQIEAIHA
ncbi:MAG: 50S ribosomal protein L21 [Planctomycetota bacterium]